MTEHEYGGRSVNEFDVVTSPDIIQFMYYTLWYPVYYCDT